MKKVLLLILLITLTVVITGCEKIEYHLPDEGVFCHDYKYDRDVELNDDEKAFFIDMFNTLEWKKGLIDADFDFIFNTKEQTIKYSSSSGVFNDYTNKRHIKGLALLTKHEINKLILLYYFERKTSDTSLDLWILQEVSDYDFTGFVEDKTHIDGCLFYGKGYEPVIKMDGSIEDPAIYVKYIIKEGTRFSHPGNYVMKIFIHDPSVYIFGLTNESTVEEFDEVLSKYDFTKVDTQEKLDDGALYKEMWICGDIYITLTKRVDEGCTLYIEVERIK